jgi:hypothetical protein
MSETSNALRAMSVSSALPSLFPMIIIDPLAVGREPSVEGKTNGLFCT